MLNFFSNSEVRIRMTVVISQIDCSEHLGCFWIVELLIGHLELSVVN